MKNYIFIVVCTIIIVFFTSCDSCNKPQIEENDELKPLITNKAPEFSGDNCFAYIQKQLSFGFRVPGTSGHKQCADYLFAELKQFCDSTIYQKGKGFTSDNKEIPIYNIIGQINPKATKRFLFFAHWDSRPWADNDTAKKDKPILAANDGASGIAVLLEMAKMLKQKPVKDIGIDIIFFDAEDLGRAEVTNSFCLGSQYWGRNLHVPNYRASAGIGLDMVGGKDGVFYKEGYSLRFGNSLVTHVWKIASELGYENLFIDETHMGEVTDDHFYVNSATNTPVIDIISYSQQQRGGFNATWHKHSDNLDNIDKSKLQKVGNTLMHTLYNLPPIYFSN